MGPRRLVETRPTGHGRARGLVSSRVSGGRIESRSYAVADDLRDVVATYWMGRWDLRGQPPHTTELLGDPCVHLVFEEGESQPGSRIVGVWTRLWRRTLDGRGSVRGVKLRAGAVRAFVDLPALSLANRITPMPSVFPEAKKIARAVLGAQDDSEAFAAFEAWLRKIRRRSDRRAIGVAVAMVDRIGQDTGITTVDRLAAVTGLGVRALQRLFRDHVGATPKWVIRRNRLQEVALRLERGESVALADLAIELGYTDQAHLTRDFKSATGKTPREFAITVRK
jgi:AraC-like DNA-binding protein